MSSDVKIDEVRSYSSGTIGRALNTARGVTYPIDSSTRPGDVPTTIESFLSGISACGVTLIELHAQQKGLPFGSLEVAIEGIRTEASMPDFATIDIQFQFAGIDQEQAAYYVDVWKKH